VDGWRFPVKPTCLLLYYLALAGGIGAVAFGAAQLLASGTSNWIAWASFGFGFFLVPVVLADWPEPLILDGQGLLEGGCASSRIRWQELKHVREYRIRCDRGVVIQGAGASNWWSPISLMTPRPCSTACCNGARFRIIRCKDEMVPLHPERPSFPSNALTSNLLSHPNNSVALPGACAFEKSSISPDA
jgi:hypothetical protein